MIARLGDVCTKITDGSHNPPQGIPHSEYLMLSSKNIYDDEITLDDPRFLSAENYATENKRTQISPGDILLTIVGTVGRAAVVSNSIKNICLQRSVAVIKPKSNLIDSRFLMYQLQSMRTHLEQEARGVAQKGIYLKQVENLQIKVPSVDEQLQVVKMLDKVSELIALRKEQLAALDQLVKSRFIELFGDIVLNPFNWEKEQLGMVCDVRDGTHDSPQYYETGYPLVTSKNVTGGKIDLTDCSLICEADFNKINERSKVDIGDIIMPMIGTVGKPVIVDVEPNFAIKNVSLIKFKDHSRVLNIFIRALLQSDYFDEAVLSKVRGGTQKFISLGDIRKLAAIVPPMALQEQFAAFVEQTDKSKLAIQRSLDELETLKKALMQKHFG